MATKYRVLMTVSVDYDPPTAASMRRCITKALKAVDIHTTIADCYVVVPKPKPQPRSDVQSGE